MALHRTVKEACVFSRSCPVPQALSIVSADLLAVSGSLPPELELRKKAGELVLGAVSGSVVWVIGDKGLNGSVVCAWGYEIAFVCVVYSRIMQVILPRSCMHHLTGAPPRGAVLPLPRGTCHARCDTRPHMLWCSSQARHSRHSTRCLCCG